MKKILVPCDFSEYAINAFRQALDVASQGGAGVHLLHVVEPPLLNDTVLMPTLYFEEEEMKSQKKSAEDQFKDLVKLGKRKHVTCTFEVRIGPVSNLIQDCIKDHDIDMVIMGSKGASGLKEFFIGSNAEKVVRESPVPVLVVKTYNGRPIRKIVFPNTLDTVHQEDLVMKVKDLQHFFKAQLCIVYINLPSKFEVESTLHQHLQEFADRFMFKDYTIHVHTHDSTEKGIIEFTKIVDGDLIAMGTHGRTGITHLVKGSVAEDIVNHTECPIWTYRMKEQLAETTK